MLLELEHEFGHASRRLNNVPYVPGDDLPVLSDESILKVRCRYVRVPMSGEFTYGHSQEHGYGYDNNRILDENFKLLTLGSWCAYLGSSRDARYHTDVVDRAVVSGSQRQDYQKV
jgi:hypothetical protein